MKRNPKWWKFYVAAALSLLSITFYLIRWSSFPTALEHREMLRYILGDIAFLFLQVLLVTVFIDGAIQQRAKEDMKQKLNMVVGAFFSQTGTELLGLIATADAALGEVREQLVADSNWKPDDYRRALEAFSSHKAAIDLNTCDLARLKTSLSSQKSYFLGLLGNQSLLEHEQFTDLLWAVTHLAEELEVREDLASLPATDIVHLKGDVRRAYLLLGTEWIGYLSHLQASYPYLFSLAMRSNPLDPDADVILGD